MKKIVTIFISIFLVLFFSLPSFAQVFEEKLKLEDIYKNGVYTTRRYGSVRWLKDSKGYSTLERNRETRGVDIVKYDAKTGNKTMLVSSEALTPEGEDQPLSVSDYIWSEDNSKLLIFTNTRRVWRYNTRGDYWVLDLGSGNLQQLGKSVERATMMFAKFSPDASRVAYVSKQNIFVEDCATGMIKQITHDGGDNIINGTFDWVYEEELGCRDGFRWSPDGRNIAYWQSDTEGTGVFYMINNVDSVYSVPIPLPYPKAGTTNSAVKIGVVPAEGGETRWFDIPGDPSNNYLARMDFIPNSSEVMIQQVNRKQNTNRVWVGNVITMELDNILTDRDEAFLDIHDNIMWLDNEQYFTWSSETDGWLHLYKVSRNGKQMDLITKGEFDVIGINCIDPRGGYVYYIASPEKPAERYLYRSRIDGKGVAERVSPAGMVGQHSYQMTADAKWAIHTFQNVTTPPIISLISLPDHKEARLLVSNEEAKKTYESLGLNPKEFFRVDIGDVELDGWMIKPRDFDPLKKYPVIFYIYGEPAGATVQNSWGGGDLWHQYLAQQGYLVMSIDPRGTRSPRGRDWRKIIYKKIGIVAPIDHAAGVRKIIETYPYVDGSKIGIHGWSGGGQMTLNCMFRFPELYKTGIAVAFVADQKNYDTIYQERYMSTPQDNPEGYRDGSPITHAYNLQGNLLIMHGTADDNVHYQSTEMLINELVKHNKMFSMMSYPMRSHGISERENTTYHLRQTMLKFWIENLPPGAN
ncbi:MAG TPA: DPP IV N-terminal domain-containing protein [Bacteroidales bacterium]|nr:DPP IV N-terminal domain-containing protein [Bacteroidales bacterium]